jgi:hypothetical protein
MALLNPPSMPGDPLGLFSYIFTSGAVLVSRICNPWLMGIAHVLRESPSISQLEPHSRG